MTQAQTKKHVKGVAVLSADGHLVVQFGVVSDPRIRSMVTDTVWLEDALKRRVVPILLTEARYLALSADVEEGRLILIFEEPSENVLKFFMSVDFAVDIIDHIISDPYDAMAIIDDDSRLVFVSPVHEKFFGLLPGEAAGRKVTEVIENTRLNHVVSTGVAEVGQIQKMRGSERVVSRHPIRRDGKVVGAIGRVMFKGPQQVEALARRIKTLENEIASYKSESDARRREEEALSIIVGESQAIRSVREEIRKVAALDIPVLIQGESGTGKELVAQALHRLSPRHSKRLITVNAAALPASLVESELFGYEAGSFTGADRKGRAGKFELADKGTIFLDEIGDMPLEVQSKLLRVLQDRIVERVGGDRARKIDFRLVSATNRDLERFIETEKFRLDLFFRISPVVITLPRLSDHIEDIPLLVEHFLRDIAGQYGRAVPHVPDEVHDFLMSRKWPGNVRELRHILERALVFCEGDNLRVSNFSKNPSTEPVAEIAGSSAALPRQPAGSTLKEQIDQLENQLIADALERFKGNKKRAAEHLQVSRSYLYKKLGE